MAKTIKTTGGKKISNEDKALFYYYKVTEFFEKYKKQSYVVLIAVVVIVAAFFIYTKTQNANNEAAAIELTKVKSLYSAGNYDQAMNGDSAGTTKGLINLVTSYGSTENGQAAKILLANCYYYKGDFNNAEKYYNSYSGGNAFFKAASAAGLASVLEAKKDFLNAAKEYEKASKISSEFGNSDEYLFYAIRAYYWANDKDKLKKSVEALKTDYPKSKYISQIDRYNTIISN